MEPPLFLPILSGVTPKERDKGILLHSFIHHSPGRKRGKEDTLSTLTSSTTDRRRKGKEREARPRSLCTFRYGGQREPFFGGGKKEKRKGLIALHHLCLEGEKRKQFSPIRRKREERSLRPFEAPETAKKKTGTLNTRGGEGGKAPPSRSTIDEKGEKKATYMEGRKRNFTQTFNKSIPTTTVKRGRGVKDRHGRGIL